MIGKRVAVVAGAAVLAIGGAGTAIAVTRASGPDKAEDAVIRGAAKRLHVTPKQLRDALTAAENAQLEKAVKEGRLTQEQADAIRRHRGSGHLRRLRPGTHPGRPWFHGPGPRFGGPMMGVAFDELARALGMTKQALGTALRDGRSIADVAKAQGTDLDAVKRDLEAAAKQRVDAAVAAKKLTRAQGDMILGRIERMIDALDTLPAPGRWGPPPWFRHGGPGAPPDPPS